MLSATATDTVGILRQFLFDERSMHVRPLTAVSLFSGVGLADLGYDMAGFRFLAQAELLQDRVQIGRANFPGSVWVQGDLRDPRKVSEVVAAVRAAGLSHVDLLAVTPPCQGMSSSNPSRGRRVEGAVEHQEHRNSLLLAAAPIASALQPRVIVAENVRQHLTLKVRTGEERRPLIELFGEQLPEYYVFQGVVQMADYGIPQDRRRAIVVAVRRTEGWLDWLLQHSLSPWPRATHGGANLEPWVSVSTWMESMEYPSLDARDPALARDAADVLHYVPSYDARRYRWVSDIPPRSGRNAYQNDKCPVCGYEPVPEGQTHCDRCGEFMTNRPHVVDTSSGTLRLISGFKSSYRRMTPDRPAPTVMTASSHLGSDHKIHPWENRVLSVRECADLQTVPRFYDWSRARVPFLIREAVGEALPPYFTYVHGKLLADLLLGRAPAQDQFADRDAVRG